MGVFVIVVVVVGVVVAVGVDVVAVGVAVVVTVVVGIVLVVVLVVVVAVVVATVVVVGATAEFSCNTEYTQLETRRKTLARFKVAVVGERLLSHDRLFISPLTDCRYIGSRIFNAVANFSVSYHFPQFC